MDLELKIFSGSANFELSSDISRHAGVPLGKMEAARFSDGETRISIDDNVRGSDVFIIQPTAPPVNESVMELLIIIDALRRASAGRITAVMPYYGYARQDRKSEPRVPITAKLIANLITAAGAKRVLALDLHAAQIQGFFDIPVDHLYATPVFLEYFKDRSNTVVVSPDAGGVERARAFGKRMTSELAIVDKRRPKPNQSEILNLIGDVEGKRAVIVDDIVDTAGTIVQVAALLKKNGAKEILCVCTHAILSGDAKAKIEDSAISKIITTDTIYHAQLPPKILKLSVAGLLADAIKRIHANESVSSLFV
ncbi:MAG: ribose-phosphate pyrophosphokinase [Endomicrobiia bacterium]|nr:ribose-phosphate pyrophosphokinase [Endomicrobiia bacterium]